MPIIFNSKYPWQYLRINNHSIYIAGFWDYDFSHFLKYLSDRNFQEIEKVLKQQTPFGLMIEGPGFIFAAIDYIRSFPVFYCEQKVTISNHPQDLDEDLQNQYSPEDILSFTMAGYTIGEKTLHKNIKQLRQGEYLYISSLEKILGTHRIYKPHPNNLENKDYKKALNTALDNAIKKTIKQANGKPIYVPLSGGYDSRLVLAKLHEHDYPDLKCFSYGLKNNFEAKTAAQVANVLGVPWQMIESRPRHAQSLYESPLRKEYEEFAFGYSCIPSYVEFEAFARIHKEKLIPEESFIVNGQTGDFISGGHIPSILYEQNHPTINDLYSYIINKHFSIWASLKSDRNIGIIKNMIACSLQQYYRDLTEKTELISAYEHFEWRERQGKVVVQNQRIYDFFHYRWLLPLWDPEIADFFETLPFELKYKQALFKDYLDDYNYKGLFSIPRAQPQNWGVFEPFIICFANVIGLFISLEAKEKFYKKMLYYGHSHHQYALFGKALYDAHFQDIRNMISLAVYKFCKENNLPFPKP